nr:hypothetical protein [Tanacetum cinerariifolium]
MNYDNTNDDPDMNLYLSKGGIFAITTVQPTSSTVHGSERGWQPRSDHRMRKLKMPLFKGEDVYGWVYQVERFFEVQGLITTEDRLRAAVLSLEGSALSWFRWINNREPFRSWEELKRRLLHRFQPSQNGNLLEQFFSISQQGTAREYVTLFEKMAAQLPSLTEEVLGGVFIKGLTPELRTAVRTQQPTTLGHAMDLTILIDESRTGGVGDQRGGTVPKPTPTGWWRGIPRPLGVTIGGGAKDKQMGTNRPPFKRLTETEFAAKKAKGLCYRCDEKFLPGHRCPAKTLQLLFIPEGDEEGVDDDHEDAEHFHLDLVEVSAQSVAELFLPGPRVTEDFYPLELGSTDVILGIKWLRQLGEVRVNWKRLTMTFQNGDNRVTLCGEPGL